MPSTISVSGIDLEVEERGSGRPLLFLHSGEGLQPNWPWLDALAENFRVIAPNHPGWGGSPLPRWVSSVDDLAYLYLDLAAQIDLQDAFIVGNSFGGWIAAEMLVRDASRFSANVLAAPLGCKFEGRTTREITDMHSLDRETLAALAWADPARGSEDYPAKSEVELTQIVQGREAFALFGWKPYMHSPRLKNWLHRITVPTMVVWGEQDQITGKAYAEHWVNALPTAGLATIADAGHYPQFEQPEAFASLIAGFALPE